MAVRTNEVHERVGERNVAAGHICTVMGWTEYEPVAARYRVPIVVTGFAPGDLLEGMYFAVRQLEEGRHEVGNQHVRSVRRDGTIPARHPVTKVFRLVDRKWRGLGEIPGGPAGGVRRRRHRVSLRSGRHARGGTGRSPRGRRPPRAAQAVPAFRLRCPVHPRAPRWARRWCPPKGPAPPTTTTTAGTAGPGRRRSEVTQGYAAGPLACPVPLVATDRVQLGHGSGGKMSAALLRDSFLPHRGNPDLARLGEGAVVDTGAGEIAVSTDIFVLSPLEFPGGDSGALAVHGTFNDVAMMGARPLFLTAVFVLVEGLLVERLERIVRSMGERAASAGVPVITGDTKVVEQGRMASRSILRASASWMPASAPRPTGLARATRCW